jgi:hypothetical protein
MAVSYNRAGLQCVYKGHHRAAMVRRCVVTRRYCDCVCER